MQRIGVYARVSTARQAQAQSTDQQLERLRAHVAAHGAEGWDLREEHIFRDDGYSGARLQRPGLDQLRDAIKMNEEVSTLLKDLGLDPFKDIDRVLAAQPATSEQDKGLVIVRGRFDLAKIRARAEKEAKDNKDTFKIQKVKDGQGGEHTIYKFQVPNPQGGEVTLYAGLASKTVILAAPSKDYLIDALKVKPDATKLKKLKSKAFQDLLLTIRQYYCTQHVMTFYELLPTQIEPLSIEV